MILLRHCFEQLQHCSSIAMLCCAKNRRCESSRVTSPLSNTNLAVSSHILVGVAQKCLCLIFLFNPHPILPIITLPDQTDGGWELMKWSPKMSSTLLHVSSTSVLRVASPLLKAWIKVCNKGLFWDPCFIWFTPLWLERSLSATVFSTTYMRMTPKLPNICLV